jgi:NAD(P)-dependent dehydrogenase (short-subunit alcohol dehydrogenase family)
MQRLTDKVALITGGNSGIGRATALLFAQEGACVVITGRNEEKGKAVAAEIERAGGSVTFLRADVRDADDCERIVDAVIRQFERIDILFNNAGIVPYGTALETSVELWNDTWATNVSGTFFMSRAVLPHMIACKSGVIVNNASDWGIVAGQNCVAYCATKGAVVQMTRALALDHGRQGIRVNAVCPGDTYVERWRSKWRPKAGESLDDYLKELGESFALGRVGAVEEIARAVLFLASDESSYMTGALLVVDGGNTAGGSSTRFG